MPFVWDINFSTMWPLSLAGYWEHTMGNDKPLQRGKGIVSSSVMMSKGLCKLISFDRKRKNCTSEGSIVMHVSSDSLQKADWVYPTVDSHTLPSVSCPWDGVSEHPLNLPFVGGFINVINFLCNSKEFSLMDLICHSYWVIHGLWLFCHPPLLTYEWQIKWMLTNAISGKGNWIIRRVPTVSLYLCLKNSG